MTAQPEIYARRPEFEVQVKRLERYVPINGHCFISRVQEQRKAVIGEDAPCVLLSSHGSVENRELLDDHAIGL